MFLVLFSLLLCLLSVLQLRRTLRLILMAAAFMAFQNLLMAFYKDFFTNIVSPRSCGFVPLRRGCPVPSRAGSEHHSVGVCSFYLLFGSRYPPNLLLCVPREVKLSVERKKHSTGGSDRKSPEHSRTSQVVEAAGIPQHQSAEQEMDQFLKRDSVTDVSGST